MSKETPVANNRWWSQGREYAIWTGSVIIRRQPVFPVVWSQCEPEAVIRTHSVSIGVRLVHGIAIVSLVRSQKLQEDA